VRIRAGYGNAPVFDPQTGDRIVRNGAVELMGPVAPGNTYHQYIIIRTQHARRGIFEVHGLWGMISCGDKPKFAQIGQEFLDFIGDSKPGDPQQNAAF